MKEIFDELSEFEMQTLGLARDLTLFKQKLSELDTDETPLQLAITDIQTALHGLQCVHSALEWIGCRLGATKQEPEEPQVVLSFDKDAAKICGELNDMA